MNWIFRYNSIVKNIDIALIIISVLNLTLNESVKFKEYRTIWFYFLTFIWIIIISSNYYFHGCILARIERELLQDETWAGPINITLYPIHLFYKPNKQILNEYIKYFWATPISTLIILKYLLDDNITNKFIGFALCSVLIPLLFIHSQFDLFSYLV